MFFVLFVSLTVFSAFMLVSVNRYEYTEELAQKHCNQELPVFFDKRLNSTHWVCEARNGSQKASFGLTPGDIPHISGGVAP